MLVLGAFYIILGAAHATLTPVDTIRAGLTSPSDTVSFIPARTYEPADTVRKRRKAIEVSEWYGRRLTIHRYVAFATIPVFAAQWVAGDQLYDKSRDAPTWAKTTHRVGATTLAAMFTVNTVTGAWNWWDSRSVPQGRVLRTMHALSILGADAAFTYAGAKLSDEAENSASKRRQHKTVALSAMGVTVASGLMMKLWNR
jgi:hypothetical protein